MSEDAILALIEQLLELVPSFVTALEGAHKAVSSKSSQNPSSEPAPASKDAQ
jgi:hypothetical protein